jgi:phosphatidylserine/phosphatidylglycerophosphate/cardiolipin synthase-like enzyme
MRKKRRKKSRTGRSRTFVRALILILLLVLLGGVVWEGIGATRRAGVREILRGARDRVERLANPERRATLDPFGPEAPRAVQVFFGPAEALNPWGMDDYFLYYLNSAEESIYCACYELEYLPAAEVLIEQHYAGVRVGIVSDSDYADEAGVQACMEAGIPVVFDRRSPFMHNKFCIVDGERVWTGSTNITENGFFRNNNNALLIRSDALGQNYLREFGEMWRGRSFGGQSPANTPYPIVNAEGIACYFAPEDDVEEEIIAEVLGALRRIEFMAFSFTSEPIAEAMAARIGEGVQVRGLFEGRNAGSRYSRDDYLRERGATIYLDSNPYSMHHKVIVIDGEVVVTGSYNFSKNADTKNDENVLVIRDAEIAGKYLEEFERLVQ